LKSLKLNPKSNFILFHIIKKINPIICIYVKVIPLHATLSLSLSLQSPNKNKSKQFTLRESTAKAGRAGCRERERERPIFVFPLFKYVLKFLFYSGPSWYKTHLAYLFSLHFKEFKF
jgi:hypothetical protein